MGDFFISGKDLNLAIGGPNAPLLFDVRRRDAFDADTHIIPSARWRDHARARELASEIPAGKAVVAYCVHGHQVSQSAVAVLRACGVDARILDGGIEGWREAGGMTLLKPGMPGGNWTGGTGWVTRIRPKIDRIACPWLIRRFIDPSAAFYFVAPDQVGASAEELGAIPYDIEGVDFSHEGERCSFDIFLDRFGVTDPALRDIATIVRGADTARPELAPEAAGLLALSLGLSALADGDDATQLEHGMPFYDALYAWRRFAAGETHNWPARESAA